MIQGYHVELVYENDETSGEQTFTTFEEAKNYFDETIIEVMEESPFDYNYITLYKVEGEDDEELDDMGITNHVETYHTYDFNK